MALSPLLRDVLVCPRCHGGLEFHEEAGEVHCLTCRLAYPIRDDIPEMLPERARPLPPAGADAPRGAGG